MIFKTRNLFLAQLLGLSLLLGAFSLCAAVPKVLNHQGRVSVDGKNFDGSGQFKFALVDGEGTTSFWSNDGTSNGGGEPSNPVTLAVTKGLYSVLLGDDTLDNMTVIPVSALDNGGVRLRVWFSDGSNGFQQFSPDQRLAATPYAIQAVEATGFSGALAGDVTGTQGATAISASTVTGKLLTGYVSSAGTISSSDSILNAIKKLNGNDALKADLNNPTFTGTVSGITKSMVGLGNVDNTADVDKPVSTAQQEALDLKASLSALNLKAPLASPTFTGTVSGITKSMVGLGNVDNTADADKPISTAQQAAFLQQEDRTDHLEFLQFIQANEQHVRTDALEVNKAPLESPTFTGTVSGITKSMVGLGNVDNTADADKPISDLTQAALDGKQAVGSYATLVDGTVPASQLPSYVDDVVEFAEVENFPAAGEVGKIYVATATGKIYRWSGSVYIGIDPSPGSSDAVAEGSSNLYYTNERASAAAPVQSVAGKSGVVTLSKVDVGLGNVDNTADVDKPVSTAQQEALDLKASLSALNLKAPLASPTFTGTVSGITKSMVGLGNVDNTADADKPISTAQQAAFLQQEDRTDHLEFLQFIQANEQHVRTDALEVNKAPLESPTFTGTVSGITKSMVGLGNVDNTADADKPISDLTQAALDGKQAVGNYATLVDGMIPVNQLPLTLDNITAAPALPVIAFGRNDLGQTTVPGLANVAEIAARESHSLVLLKNGTVVTWGNGPSVPANLESVAAVSAGSSHDLVVKTNGTVLAWGDNTYGQTAVPSGITAATQAAAGEKHSLILLSTGAVTAWGNNSFGQTTVPDAASTNVIAIAAGYDHSLALKADGTVVAWGRSDAGQINVPVGLSNVIAIAAGAYHSLAVKSDGKVVAWGWNNGGQITVPADLSGVMKVTAGYAFSAALKSDGTLVAWGDNSYGQITIPATATQVTYIAAGANHMLVLRDDLVSAQLARLDQDNVFTSRVGIGRSPATNTLEVAGNASKSIAGSWLSNSDRRIKTDVESITGGLEMLDKVRLVDFRYTDDYLAAHPEIDDKRYPNVIAQEFAEVFPDHVKESGEFLADGSPILQVDTYPLTIYSAVAVQELHRDSLELRKQNEFLRQQLKNQANRLDKLEALLESR